MEKRKKKKDDRTFCIRAYDLNWSHKLKGLPPEVYVRLTDDDLTYARQTILKLPPTALIEHTMEYLVYTEIYNLLRDYFEYELDQSYKYAVVKEEDVPLDAELFVL